MNAWYVRLNDCDSAYVLAETAGKAKWGAIVELEGWGGDWDHGSWAGLHSKRVPELDGETITERQLLEGGYMSWAECPCGNRVFGPALNDDFNVDATRSDGVVYDDQGRAYCSEACRERPSPTRTGQSTAWLLSTEY